MLLIVIFLMTETKIINYLQKLTKCNIINQKISQYITSNYELFIFY